MVPAHKPPALLHDSWVHACACTSIFGLHQLQHPSALCCMQCYAVPCCILLAATSLGAFGWPSSFTCMVQSRQTCMPVRLTALLPYCPSSHVACSLANSHCDLCRCQICQAGVPPHLCCILQAGLISKVGEGARSVKVNCCFVIRPSCCHVVWVPACTATSQPKESQQKVQGFWRGEGLSSAC